MNFENHFREIPWPLKSRRRGDFNSFLVLKLVVVFTLVFSAVAYSKSFSQVDINVQRATLKEVLTEVSKQTGYAFMYRDANVKDAKYVSVKLKGVSLENALEAIFAGQPLDYIIKEQSVVVMKKQQSYTGTAILYGY